MKLTSIGLLASISLTACAALNNADIPHASANDFRVLEGNEWTGELEYLNFGRDDRSSIPVGLKVVVLNDSEIEYAIKYPGEEQHNAVETLTLSDDNSMIDGSRIASRETVNGDLILITVGAGTDDGQDVTVRTTYEIAEARFHMRKDVRRGENETFFNRNEYRFTR